MQKKKDGLQQYRVRINYVDRQGKPRQLDRVAYGMAEAKQLETTLAQECSSPQGSTARMTVQALFDEFVATHKNEVRATSAQKTKSTIEQQVIPTFGATRLSALTVAEMQKWKNSVAQKDLKIKTKQNYYKYFNILLNWGVKMEYLPSNPLKKLGNFSDVNLELHTREMSYYTSAQFLKFRKVAAASEDWGFYVFFCIAFYTGMRKGEINALKWSDIDGDYIQVRRSVSQKLKGGDVETPPKNKSSIRSLQMPQPLTKALNDHKARQMRDPRFTEDFRVCGGPSCLRDSSIENRNRQYCAAANLPHIRIHDFRHSHASLLANEGINIQEIARRLGHSNVQQTWNTYAHLYPREEERAVQILDKIV